MLTLAVNTVRDRWHLFAGAVLTVAMGVALVQSSLLVLASTGTPDVPPGTSAQDAARIRDAYEGAAVLMGMTVMLSTFLAVFVVSSTFAFTVAQRRKDLALLRLVGASRGQLRRLLLGEALLLGVVGTGIGIPLGVLAMWVQSWVLVAIGLMPTGFTASWVPWVSWFSVMVGVGVSLTGVFAASLRAAKVRPLEALRETGAAARVMTFSRWFFGLGYLAVAACGVVAAQAGDLLVAVAVALGVSVVGAVAMSQLSPLVVPLVGRLFGVALRATPLGDLARSNLRDGVRRNASTAAPLIVLVALLLGLTGTLDSIAFATGEEQRRIVAGDLVVDGTGAAAARIAAVPGVAAVSTEATVQTTMTVPRRNPRARPRVLHTDVTAVDTAAYQRMHRLAPRRGTLHDLRGNTIAVGPGMALEGFRLGTTVSVTIAGRPVPLKVVALMPETLDVGENFLVPRELLQPAVAAGARTQTVVQVADRVDPAVVAARIRAADIGTVRTLAQWAAAKTAAEQDESVMIMAVLMGLSGLYALVAVINAVVIAGAERGTEFAVARVTGLSRRQVVWMALVESSAVTGIGLLLGCVVAAGALSGIRTSMDKAIGVPVVAVPWQLLGVVTVAAFLITGLTTVLTTLAATRRRPVTLVGA